MRLLDIGDRTDPWNVWIKVQFDSYDEMKHAIYPPQGTCKCKIDVNSMVKLIATLSSGMGMHKCPFHGPGFDYFLTQRMAGRYSEYHDPTRLPVQETVMR